jgi:hypothetical protein
MKEIDKIKKEFYGLKNKTGASFVGISNYQNKNNEIANYVINTNIDYNQLKLNDLKILQKISKKDIFNFAKKYNYNYNEVEDVINELITSLIQNTSNNKTVASLIQDNIYEHITNNIKFHKKFNKFYIYGIEKSKKIIKEGNIKKEIKNSDKTILKKIIASKFKLKCNKYRLFITDEINEIKMNNKIIKDENL